MTYYLDTSVLVSALTNEPSTPRVTAWFASRTTEPFAISEWVVTEFASALSIKMRTGRLETASRAEAQSKFNRLCARSFSNLPFGTPEFQAAASFAGQHTLSLRGGDALHLAICAHHGATLCTLDDRLAEAGGPLGIATTRL